MTPAEAVAFVAFLLVAAALGAFGWAFRDRAATEAALARLGARQRAFRWGFLPLLLGIAVTSEAQAVIWRAGVPRDHPAFLAPQAAGLALILAGLAVMNLAVWRAAPSEAAGGG